MIKRNLIQGALVTVSFVIPVAAQTVAVRDITDASQVNVGDKANQAARVNCVSGCSGGGTTTSVPSGTQTVAGTVTVVPSGTQNIAPTGTQTVAGAVTITPSGTQTVVAPGTPYFSVMTSLGTATTSAGNITTNTTTLMVLHCVNTSTATASLNINDTTGTNSLFPGSAIAPASVVIANYGPAGLKVTGIRAWANAASSIACQFSGNQ